MYRVAFTSSDGKPSSVNIRVSPKSFRPGNLRQVADCLRVDIAALDDALAWTPAQLVEHLSRYPVEVYNKPANLRLYTNHPPRGPTDVGAVRKGV